MQDDIIQLELACERCDGKGCEYCFGEPEVVRTIDGHRLCEDVTRLTDMDGTWAEAECSAVALYRLEFTCLPPSVPEPTKCVLHVCAEHRPMAVSELTSEHSTLDAVSHRDHGFPVIGKPIGPEMMGCPFCAEAEGWSSVEAWDASWDHVKRDLLPQREIVEHMTVFPADPTTAYVLACGHTIL